MSTLPYGALSQVRNHRIITIPPLTDLIVLCAICATVRRKDVRSRRYVQKKLASINTFDGFLCLISNLYLPVRDRRTHVHLLTLHSVTQIMQCLAITATC